MALEEALNHDFVKQYAGMVSTTVNHNDDFNKFRIVFKLDRTIRKSTEMKSALNGISKKFGGDPGCTDACRMFYGSKNSNPVVPGNKLTDEVLEELIETGSQGCLPNPEKSRGSTRILVCDQYSGNPKEYGFHIE